MNTMAKNKSKQTNKTTIKPFTRINQPTLANLVLNMTNNHKKTLKKDQIPTFTLNDIFIFFYLLFIFTHFY